VEQGKQKLAKMSDMADEASEDVADGMDPAMMEEGGGGGILLPGNMASAKLASQSLMAVQVSISKSKFRIIVSKS
jgi:hypothetical protein